MTTSPPETSLPDSRHKVLRRCPHRRMIGGVAVGLANYLDVDAGTVRIAFVIFALVGGVALPIYLAAWLLVPDEEDDMSIVEDLIVGHQRARY
jgi:phage shock protein PspC (stress-responsive transcriptional regulator)